MTTALALIGLPLLAIAAGLYIGWRWRGSVEARRQAAADAERAAAIAAEERRLRQTERSARRVREAIAAKARGGNLRGALGDLGVQSPQSGDDPDMAHQPVSGAADPVGPPAAGDGDDGG